MKFFFTQLLGLLHKGSKIKANSDLKFSCILKKWLMYSFFPIRGGSSSINIIIKLWYSKYYYKDLIKQFIKLIKTNIRFVSIFYYLYFYFLTFLNKFCILIFDISQNIRNISCFCSNDELSVSISTINLLYWSINFKCYLLAIWISHSFQ